MDEFALIRRWFAPLAPGDASVTLGVGDDCALLRLPDGEELAVTTDTLVAGRHFPPLTAPADIGWKALAVNLSDLAAMGARARWFTLALTLPEIDEGWLDGFAAGLAECARSFGVALVGGDTTRGPLAVTIAALGSVPAGAALTRSGARAGDAVCVTGTLGDAALALRRLDDPQLAPALRRRLDRPTPRLAAGLALRGLATSAIDLSDGLGGDLPHVLSASGVGADVEAVLLPMSEAFRAQRGDPALQWSGGDDYELCVTLPPARLLDARLDVALTRIGTITAEPGLRMRDESGKLLGTRGYRHFP